MYKKRRPFAHPEPEKITDKLLRKTINHHKTFKKQLFVVKDIKDKQTSHYKATIKPKATK